MTKRRSVSPLIPIAASVAIVGSVFAWSQCRATGSLHTQPGDPLDGFVVDDATSVIVDRVRVGGPRSGTMASGYRISAIDVATGKLVAERVLEPVTCWAAKPHRIWCDGQDGLVLLAIPQLTEVARVDDVVQRAGRGKPVRGEYRRDGGDVVVLLPDGGGLQIDATTLAVSDGTMQGGSGATSPSQKCKTQSSSGNLGFGPGPRHALVRRGEPTADEGATFLRKDMPPDFLDLGDPALVLVLHDSSLDPAASIKQLSRVDPQSLQRRWTVELGKSCQSATVIGKQLVISTTDPAHRVVAVDIESGSIVWRFAFPAS